MSDPYTSTPAPFPPEPTTPAGYPSTPTAPAARYAEQDVPVGDSTPDGSGAREQASHLAATAKDEAAGLAGTAKDAATSVLQAEKSMARETTADATQTAKATLAEARVQVSALWNQSRDEISHGAGVQLGRLSSGARSLSQELDSMAAGSETPGLATDLARRASGYLTTAGDWLDNRRPEDVLADVRQFARRSPGTFLAIAAGLGLVAGRVTRSLAGSTSDSDASDASTGETTAVPAPDAAPVLGSADPLTAPLDEVPVAAPAPTAATGYGTGYGAGTVTGTEGYTGGYTAESTDTVDGGGLR